MQSQPNRRSSRTGIPACPCTTDETLAIHGQAGMPVLLLISQVGLLGRQA
jgi:hypothetical protein